jgi:oligopeptide/dipeptide ABC transporter ATP-binding protein
MQPLLRLVGLDVQFAAAGNVIHAINGASLEIFPGEVVGVLGESGSGKSTLAKSLIHLLPSNARVTSKTFQFAGREISSIDASQMRSLRGDQIATIPQDPAVALNPVMRVGDQVAEVLRAHRNWSGKRCRQEAERLLTRVQLTHCSRRMFDAYPHQLSGGQRQRVVIAQAIACEPALVIADEPTASLDSASEREILDLFRQLKRDLHISLLFITHNPALLAGLADRVAVFYAGRIVEIGPLQRVFNESAHPYTKALLACLGPDIGSSNATRDNRFPTIKGVRPDSNFMPSGCSFAARCSQRLETCDQRRPSSVALDDERNVECLLYER